MCEVGAYQPEARSVQGDRQSNEPRPELAQDACRELAMHAAEATSFLELLTCGEPATFQTFDDSKKKRKGLSTIAHGTIDQNSARLESLNERGAGVFWMVNAGDLKGRKRENVQRVRAVFVDLDGAPLQPILDSQLTPHVIVESSPSKYHAYWLVDDLPPSEFSTAQQQLATRFNGDKAVKDLPRVMRLPGFMHCKSEPYLTHILRANDARHYQRSDLIDAFGFDPSLTNWHSSAPIVEGRRNDQLFGMARGFVQKGIPFEQVVTRLLKTNEKRCSPPLDEAEVREIASRAVGYGATGAISFDYSLCDSPKFQGMSPYAHKLYMACRRLANNSREAIFSLRPLDVESWGLGDPKTLRKYRDELLDLGLLLLHRQARYAELNSLRECALYRLNDP